MADDITENDDPPPDPLEAELVAYLDGELDAASARQVEARLAHDPAARDRAAALKRSFDLLDYLPKPEPSPDFTARTLDKLPAMKAAATSGSAPQPTAPRVGAKSGSTTTTVVPARAPGRRVLRVAAVCVAVAVFGALGYLATAAARPHLFPPRDAAETTAEPHAEPDPHIIENLPLYAVADDLAFVTELAKPEYFGDEPAVAFDADWKVLPADSSSRPTGPQLEALETAFEALPESRRREVVKLDRDLRAKAPKERDRLFRVLEAYAAWLGRLPAAERRGVLGAATPALRLRVVRDVREQQWMEALPPPLRRQADALTNPADKARLIRQWQDDAARRRDRWAFVRRHAEAFAANKSPWPFDTEAGRKEVVEFAHAAFKPDEPKRSRLSTEEQGEYRRTLALAERDGAWAWYGLTVYELNKLHPYLPEPADPKGMYADANDLPEVVSKFVRKGASGRLKAVAGRWPDFPLELHRELQGSAKFAQLPPLGPARVSDFNGPVRAFATKTLFPKLTSDEAAGLHRLEGKWPEYPREFVRLATKHDTSVPGVTPPGPPSKWDATYGTRPHN